MSIYINKDTKVITQGITGKTGQFHTLGCQAYANGKAAFVAGVVLGRRAGDHLGEWAERVGGEPAEVATLLGLLALGFGAGQLAKTRHGLGLRLAEAGQALVEFGHEAGVIEQRHLNLRCGVHLGVSEAGCSPALTCVSWGVCGA